MDDEPKRVEEEQTPADAAAAAEPEASELTELKDKYLRLAAEYDNFRKRALKERAELWTRAQADLVQRLVDALEDLSRFAHIEPSEQTAKTIHDGVDLVERKIRKELEAAGVRRVDETRGPVGPKPHEGGAAAAPPAPQRGPTPGAGVRGGAKPGELLGR